MPLRLPFGEFVLDSESRQLFRGSAEIHLQPKAFELLELLVSSRPKALTKLQIRQRLWSDAFVSDASLTVLVADLRSALGDDAKKPRYVRTVYGFGYAFAGAVGSEGSPQAARTKGAPRVLWGRQVTPLVEGENILGRDETAAVRIDLPGVSRRHAQIDVRGDGAMLKDLGSKNGTFLGEQGVPVTAPVPLPDGSTFRLGRVSLVFRRSPDDGSTVSERSLG